MNEFKEIISSSRKNLHRFESLMNKANSIINLSAEQFRKFMIAATELFVNAVVHGNKEDESKNVFVEVFVSGSSIILIVKDEGNGFDVNSLADPTLTENIMKESGRGVFIIKSLVDEFDYKITGKGSEVMIKVNKKPAE